MYRNSVPGIHISSQGGDIYLNAIVEAIMSKSQAPKGKGPWNLTAMLKNGVAINRQEPMRAEGPKERPIAVLSDQLSARMLHAMPKYGRPQNFEILRPNGYYIATFLTCV